MQSLSKRIWLYFEASWSISRVQEYLLSLRLWKVAKRVQENNLFLMRSRYNKEQRAKKYQMQKERVAKKYQIQRKNENWMKEKALIKRKRYEGLNENHFAIDPHSLCIQRTNDYSHLTRHLSSFLLCSTFSRICSQKLP